MVEKVSTSTTTATSQPGASAAAPLGPHSSTISIGGSLRGRLRGRTDTTDDLRAAERRLQAAQLAADADALDTLVDERLIFTNVDGLLYSKADDLALQRSGKQRLTHVDEEDLQVLVDGTTGVTWFLGTLSGSLNDQAFTARLRYTRSWTLHPEKGWQLVAAHVSAVVAD